MKVAALAMCLLIAYVIASIAYVYRWRGRARYSSFPEYLRKSWPVFAPLNCLLYLTTHRPARSAVLDADYLQESTSFDGTGHAFVMRLSPSITRASLKRRRPQTRWAFTIWDSVRSTSAAGESSISSGTTSHIRQRDVCAQRLCACWSMYRESARQCSHFCLPARS